MRILQLGLQILIGGGFEGDDELQAKAHPALFPIPRIL